MSGTDQTLDMDRAFWRVHTVVEKWLDPASHEAGLPPDEVVEDEGNILCTAGVNRILTLAIGGAGNPLSNDYLRLGVGNGATAPTAADTNLTGPSRWFQAMDDTYPQVANNVLTMRATVGANDANYRWEEWGADVGGGGTGASGAQVGAPLINHRVPTTFLGEKSGGVWTITTTITIT